LEEIAILEKYILTKFLLKIFSYAGAFLPNLTVFSKIEYRIGSPNDLLHGEECTRQEDKDEECPGNGLYKGLVRANQGRMEAGASAGDGQG